MAECDETTMDLKNRTHRTKSSDSQRPLSSRHSPRVSLDSVGHVIERRRAGETTILLKLNSQGKILFASTEGLSPLGYKIDDILNKSVFTTLFANISDNEWRRTFFSLLETSSKKFTTFEATVTTNSGKQLDFEWNAMLLGHIEDASTHYLCFGVDVSQYNKRIAELRQRNMTLEKIERVARIGSWEWDIDNQDLKFSKELFRIYDLEPELFDDTLENLIDNVVHPEDQEYLRSNIQAVIHEKANNNCEYRIITKDGDIRYIRHDGIAALKKFDKLSRIIGIAQDITEIRNSKDTQLHTQKLLLGTEKLAHVGSWEWDLASNSMHCSPELYRIHGIDEPDSGCMDFDCVLSAIHPDDRNYVSENIKNALVKKESWPITFRIQRPDGTIRHLLADSEIEFNHKGEAAKLVGYAQDITERVVTENALRQGNEKFSALFNQSLYGVVILNSQTGKFIDVNQRFCDLLGYSFDDFNSLSYTDITHPEDAKQDSRYFSELQQGIIKTPQWEKRYIRKDGTVVWVNLSVILVKQDSDEWHLSIVEDISKRKQFEKKLFQQREEQQLIIDSISDAILVVNKNLEIMTWNKSTLNMFSYVSKSIQSQSLRQLIPDNIGNNSDLYQSLQFSQNNIAHSNTTIEVTALKRDGKTFPLRIAIAELPPIDEGKYRLVITCHDLSHEKQQEEQLRRTHKMDALGKLTGGIAHDYNNMLGIIVGYSKLLHDALAHNPKISSYINEIQKATERGARLSRKLLAFSKNIQPDTDIVNINNILLAERDMLEKTLTPRITLQYALSDTVWPISVNSGDLEDAILNICINAMQSIEFTGTITIATANMHLLKKDLSQLALNEGDYTTVTISDTGVGISPNNLANIFDPFFTTKGQHGIGLGLSMVYSFIKRSHGDIKVISTPGKGSVFTLYFSKFSQPVSFRDARKPAQENNLQLSGKEKILVVDDEPAMLTLCCEILSSQGYQCDCKESAEQALDTIDIRNLDILISDVIMPGMDGYQFVENALNINPSLKVLLISGYTDNRHNQYAADTPIRVLQKPFGANELLNQIRTLLEAESGEESNRRPNILVMDDDENIRSLYKINLERLGYHVFLANDGEETIRRYSKSLHENNPIDIVIVDLSIPGGMGGKETAMALLKIDPDACLIVSSGDSYGEIMTNYRDFGFKAVLEKNFNRQNIKSVIEKLLREKHRPRKVPEPA